MNLSRKRYDSTSELYWDEGFKVEIADKDFAGCCYPIHDTRHAHLQTRYGTLRYVDAELRAIGLRIVYIDGTFFRPERDEHPFREIRYLRRRTSSYRR
jgi:hypothetical protein